jgi:uncharacterized membrane protein YedE/YeeE
MSDRWNIIAFISGVLFTVGLTIGGMTDPESVLAFLDVTGDWDPALALVMGGAIAVYAPAYRIITGRKHPLLEGKFSLPTKTDVDAKLVLGAVGFGVGWGLVGFCPGPTIVAMTTLRSPVLIFGVSMLAGMGVFSLLSRRS